MHLFKIIHINTKTNEVHEFSTWGDALSAGITRYRLKKALRSNDLSTHWTDSIGMTHAITLVENPLYFRVSDGVWKSMNVQE